MTGRSLPIVARTVAVLLFDALAYAVVFAAIVVGAVAPIGFAIGGDWVSVKVALFLVGIAFFGYATLRLWFRTSRRRPDRDADSPSAPPGRDSRLQDALDGLPRYPGAELPPSARITPATKLFVGSLLVLGVSYAMEAIFGVGV